MTKHQAAIAKRRVEHIEQQIKFVAFFKKHPKHKIVYRAPYDIAMEIRASYIAGGTNPRWFIIEANCQNVKTKVNSKGGKTIGVYNERKKGK